MSLKYLNERYPVPSKTIPETFERLLGKRESIYLPAPNAPGLWWYEHYTHPLNVNNEHGDENLHCEMGWVDNLKPGWWTPCVKPEGAK